MGMREKLIAIIEEVEGLYNNDFPSIEQLADGMIARGVTIPVHCKDCVFSKYFEESGTRKCRTQKGLYRTVTDDEHCSYGERKTENM